MTLLDTLAALPEDARGRMILIPLAEYVELVEARDRPEKPEIVTTHQASEIWSYSADTWSQWCREGMVAGAWQDNGDSGMWRMPYDRCAEQVERVRWAARHPSDRSRRGPWKRPATSQAPDSRPPDISPRTVLCSRFTSVGDGASDDARPEAPGVAGQGRAHGRRGGR